MAIDSGRGALGALCSGTRRDSCLGHSARAGHVPCARGRGHFSVWVGVVRTANKRFQTDGAPGTVLDEGLAALARRRLKRPVLGGATKPMFKSVVVDERRAIPCSHTMDAGDSMKYYIYVSESKIAMLYSQIGRPEDERHEASVGLDLKILKTEFKESRGVPANSFTKLNTIIAKLAHEGLIGSLHEQQPYIKGSLRMT